MITTLHEAALCQGHVGRVDLPEVLGDFAGISSQPSPEGPPAKGVCEKQVITGFIAGSAAITGVLCVCAVILATGGGVSVSSSLFTLIVSVLLLSLAVLSVIHFATCLALKAALKGRKNGVILAGFAASVNGLAVLWHSMMTALNARSVAGFAFGWVPVVVFVIFAVATILSLKSRSVWHRLSSTLLELFSLLSDRFRTRSRTNPRRRGLPPSRMAHRDVLLRSRSVDRPREYGKDCFGGTASRGDGLERRVNWQKSGQLTQGGRVRMLVHARRYVVDESMEVWESEHVVKLEDRQRVAWVHCLFSPSFEDVPSVEASVARPGDVRARVLRIYPYGTRVELRRSAPGPAKSVHLRIRAILCKNTLTHAQNFCGRKT